MGVVRIREDMYKELSTGLLWGKGSINAGDYQQENSSLEVFRITTESLHSGLVKM